MDSSIGRRADRAQYPVGPPIPERVMRNRVYHPQMTKWLLVDQFWLILPAATAIGFRLSHASREGSALGRLLSNTWRTCPRLEDNLGKLRIILRSPRFLERCVGNSSGGLG